MKITRRLNAVMPVDQDDGTTVHVHSIPVSREVFERNYLVLSKTFAAIYMEGLGQQVGPRVAGLILKDKATEMGIWEGPGSVQETLLAEIYRLTNVLVPSPQGWQTLPFHEAISKNLLNEDDRSEVINVLTFFTVASRMHRMAMQADVLNGALKLWGAETSSLNSTEYLSFLTTSTAAENSGEKKPQS